MRQAMIMCVFGLALATGAAAQPPVAPTPGAPEFSLSIPSMPFHVARRFACPKGYAIDSHPWGVSISPKFEIRPVRGAPIIGSEPRIQLTRLVDGEGTDLLADTPADARAGGAKISHGDRWSIDRVAYLFPGDGRGPSSTHRASVITDSSDIILRRLPASIREMEGYLSVSVVTEDLTREFALEKDGFAGEVAPGVELRIDPRGGSNDQASASFVITSRDGRPAPHLNFVETTCAGHSDVIPFRRRVTSTGSSGSAEWFLIGRDQDRAACRVHLVYDTHRFKMPFRLENITLSRDTSGAAPATPGTQPPRPRSLDFATVTDGYEVRLLDIRAWGEHRDPSQPPPGPIKLRLNMGVLDTRGDRVSSRFVRVRFDEVTDGSGRSVLGTGAVRVSDDRGVGGGTRFLPRPALESRGHDYRDAGRARIFSASFDVPRLPAGLARVRGTVEILEVTREVVREVELVTRDEPIELAPGVRVFVREPTIQENVLPPQPRADWVELQIDRSASERGPWGDSMPPLLNMAQSIRADGAPDVPEYHVGGEKSGSRVSYLLGRQAFFEKAQRVRLHVVLEAEARTLPFEFVDVPCANP